MKKRTCFLLLLTTLFAAAGSLQAGEETAGDLAASSGRKFVRGLGNILSSPAEIPCTMADDMHQSGASGLATGFGKGMVFMLHRILNGVTEVGTFMIPAEPTMPVVCTHKVSKV